MTISAGRADRVRFPNPIPDQVAEVGEADLIRVGSELLRHGGQSAFKFLKFSL